MKGILFFEIFLLSRLQLRILYQAIEAMSPSLLPYLPNMLNFSKNHPDDPEIIKLKFIKISGRFSISIKCTYRNNEVKLFNQNMFPNFSQNPTQFIPQKPSKIQFEMTKKVTATPTQ
jgi:hypothetical protein